MIGPVYGVAGSKVDDIEIDTTVTLNVIVRLLSYTSEIVSLTAFAPTERYGARSRVISPCATSSTALTVPPEVMRRDPLPVGIVSSIDSQLIVTTQESPSAMVFESQPVSLETVRDAAFPEDPPPPPPEPANGPYGPAIRMPLFKIQTMPLSSTSSSSQNVSARRLIDSAILSKSSIREANASTSFIVLDEF